MLKEFKEFISKGNVLDLAVGVIIGSAFGNIVTSLVDDILMPILGVIIGGVDFTKLSIKFKDASIMYGNFIQNVIDFLIMAFCIFLIVKFVNKLSKIVEEEEKKLEKLKKKKTEEVKEEVKKEEVSEEIKLLREISKSLKSQNKTSKK